MMSVITLLWTSSIEAFHGSIIFFVCFTLENGSPFTAIVSGVTATPFPVSVLWSKKLHPTFHQHEGEEKIRIFILG